MKPRGPVPTDVPTCGACGATEVVPIVYGKPSQELTERAARGEVVIGGCLVAEGMPTLVCSRCGRRT